MIKADGWLAAILEKPTFRVEAGDAAAVAAHVTEQGRDAFYFTKVDTSDVVSTRSLLAVGFFVPDVNVTLAAPPATFASARRASGIEVGAAPPDAHEDVMAIAHDSFRFTRFHLDPLIADEKANLVKKEWIRNYLTGKRGDKIFVATADGRPAGFLAALTTSHGAVIDLIAVHPRAQRRGVAQALIASFASHYAQAEELSVGTQVANAPSIRLYEATGFRFKSSQYVLHLHTRDGVPV